VVRVTPFRFGGPEAGRNATVREDRSMLSNAPVVPYIPVKDVARARKFLPDAFLLSRELA